jgi:hypothetical protein
MTSAGLDQLEREVELARERVAGDLAKLRSPATLGEFKHDVLEQARETKDEWVAKTKEAAADGVQKVLADLKQRAAANPAAALAIGAGLAWRLVRHPPIASILVGVGLVSLMRTNPDEDGIDNSELVARAGEVAGTVKGKVSEWTAEAASQASARIAESAQDAKQAATDFAERAVPGMHAASNRLNNLMPDSADRDNYLMGAAAVALAAAVGIAYQRRTG